LRRKILTVGIGQLIRTQGFFGSSIRNGRNNRNGDWIKPLKRKKNAFSLGASVPGGEGLIIDGGVREVKT
jgi:hypothetical protein